MSSRALSDYRSRAGDGGEALPSPQEPVNSKAGSPQYVLQLYSHI
jgi:hypothetical protein